MKLCSCLRAQMQMPVDTAGWLKELHVTKTGLLSNLVQSDKQIQQGSKAGKHHAADDGQKQGQRQDIGMWGKEHWLKGIWGGWGNSQVCRWVRRSSDIERWEHTRDIFWTIGVAGLEKFHKKSGSWGRWEYLRLNDREPATKTLISSLVENFNKNTNGFMEMHKHTSSE